MARLYATPLGRQVIGGAIEVHRSLGPGLLESAYERCLAHELTLNGVDHSRQIHVPLLYKGMALDCGYRVDFVVGSSLLLELKAVEHVLPIHDAQVLTYLKLLGIKQGLLINFNVARLVDGLKSFLL